MYEHTSPSELFTLTAHIAPVASCVPTPHAVRRIEKARLWLGWVGSAGPRGECDDFNKSRKKNRRKHKI